MKQKSTINLNYTEQPDISMKVKKLSTGRSLACLQQSVVANEIKNLRKLVQMAFLQKDEHSDVNGAATGIRAVFQEIVHVQAVAHRREAQQKEEGWDAQDDD